jgi:hypothetical protein
MEAEILAECGRPDEALVQLGDAMVVAHETGENWAVPEVLRVRSAVLRRLCPSGNETDIEALLRESITMAHNQGGQSWRLRSTCDLARLLRDRGEANEGLQLLKSAYEDFGGHYNEPDHRAARELIENLTK